MCISITVRSKLVNYKNVFASYVTLKATDDIR